MKPWVRKEESNGPGHKGLFKIQSLQTWETWVVWETWWCWAQAWALENMIHLFLDHFTDANMVWSSPQSIIWIALDSNLDVAMALFSLSPARPWTYPCSGPTAQGTQFPCQIKTKLPEESQRLRMTSSGGRDHQEGKWPLLSLLSDHILRTCWASDPLWVGDLCSRIFVLLIPGRFSKVG